LLDPIPALEANMRALMRLTAKLPGAEVGLEHDATWGTLGIPSPAFNLAIGRFSVAAADTRIAEISARFRRRAMPLSWWILPDSTPDDLEARLARAGFGHAQRLPAMALDLATLVNEGLPAGVAMDEVRDAEAYGPAVDVLIDAFQMPADLREPVIGAFGNLSAGPLAEPGVARSAAEPRAAEWADSAVAARTVVARLDGEVVGTALVVIDGPIAGIYNVGVRESARGRGIGRAVTAEVARIARATGCGLAILEASAIGAPVYRRLGFREVGTVVVLGRLAWS
jgi:GNAT superfamily N-acetyltransferase